MADILDNAREKTGLLKKFLESAKKINVALKENEPASQEQADILAAEIEIRDEAISEINIINKLIENASNSTEEQKSELEKENQLWFNLLTEIQSLEKENVTMIEDVYNLYMGKVKSAKNSIKVIDAYSRSMTDSIPSEVISIDKSK